jgi:thioredoxin reductase (NADPH)
MKDVVIIGGGPAGCASAIYLKRAGYSPLVIERDRIGGLLLNANLVENYPGFPKGISGKVLVALIENHLNQLNIDVERKEATDLSWDSESFILSTDGDEITSKVVIIASGTTPKDIGLSGQDSLLGRKLFYEIKDIPPHHMEVNFVIVGGGDAAFDYAMNLAEKAKRIDIVMRSIKPRCLSLLEERSALRDNIFIHPRTQPTEVVDIDDGIKLKCTGSQGELELLSEYAIIACGRDPSLDFLSKEMNKRLTIHGDGSTNFPGLFVAGDVRRGKKRQTGIAVGDGILCAMNSIDFLSGDKEE